MIARFVLAKDFYLNEEVVTLMNPDYAQHHAQRIKRLRETPKRLVYDEFHRTRSSKVIRDQVMVDMREGRKWGVHIALASQLLDDFDKDMVDMATGVWIMGVGTQRAINEAATIFGLSDTARDLLRELNGPGAAGAPFLAILNLKEGRHEHKLLNTLGPIEIWAFSTTPEDVAIRDRLYNLVGATDARRRLAKRFPGGTAKSEIDRRVAIAAERGQGAEEAAENVIDKLVEELVRAS
jgi:intracellular multiplication protein IcmB